MSAGLTIALGSLVGLIAIAAIAMSIVSVTESDSDPKRLQVKGEEDYPVDLTRYDGTGKSSSIRTTKGRGNDGAPEPVKANDSIGGLFMRGRPPSETETNQASIEGKAAVDFTDSNQATLIEFKTTATNAVTPTVRAILDEDGNFRPSGATTADLGHTEHRWNKLYANRALLAYEYPDPETAFYAVNAYSYVGANDEPTGIRLGNLRGTMASPNQIKSGDSIGGIYAVGGYGADGSATYSTDNHASISFLAAEDFTSSTNVSTQIVFRTTSTGASLHSPKIIIDENGNMYPTVSNTMELGLSGTNLWEDVWATQINGASDRRLKTIQGEVPGLGMVRKVDPISFVWKSHEKTEETPKRVLGFVAQEYREALQEAGVENQGTVRGAPVLMDKDKNPILDEHGNEQEGYLSIAYDHCVPIVWKAMQEMAVEMDALRARIQELESQ